MLNVTFKRVMMILKEIQVHTGFYMISERERHRTVISVDLLL